MDGDGEEKYTHRAKEDILAGIRNKEYIEYGEYGDHIYGIRLKNIQDIISKGKMCILDVNPWPPDFLIKNDWLEIFIDRGCC